MITGQISGTPVQISAWVSGHAPESGLAVVQAAEMASGYSAKQRIYGYQAQALYALAAQYNAAGRRILEVGTYYGYSAGVLAQAAPLAQIDTLNPTPWEYDAAKRNLSGCTNVRCYCAYSWDYLADYAGPDYDMVFIDGNHKRVRQDLPWWDRIKPGGLFLFHDYSPAESARPCVAVYGALNDFAGRLGRQADISIIDDLSVGMVGWYKE